MFRILIQNHFLAREILQKKKKLKFFGQIFYPINKNKCKVLKQYDVISNYLKIGAK